ncbi:hypothetical protein KFL_002100030 [Klebsormidium nitens]|uniref:Uncharacterized protein n=1 Tax=Klebsormidium nitens TaxID=105231 RepID=A0A1Y1I324_KLENI|nr:hypothetical protein KFL_002100030 [Klebsormidium nitens]|eukprot:GAQ84873.1 hypothetical protein KFL_002100030 [Klebsormidium nitens]
MATSAHVAMRPQALWTGGGPASARSAPAFNPLPAQVGCPLATKEKWQRMWGHASLRASLDLADSKEEAARKTRTPSLPQRRSVRCQSAPKSNSPPPVALKHYLTPISADVKKEESMVYRRTVFGHPEWLRHRSSTRHYRHILSISSSRVILALGPPVLALTGGALAMALYNEAIVHDILPHELPLLKASALPLQLTAPALALLLVFRTNASYSRFDEARKMWGATLNRVRDLARQALSYMDDNEEREEVLRYLMAFPYAFKNHLLREDHIVDDMRNVGLNSDEIEILTSTEHRPNYCLQVMSQVISKNTDLTDFQRVNLDHNLTHFHDQVGGCERIFKTPLPLSYTRLTSRFLVLWHFFLPLALWDACHWMVVPATFLSAAALFCIEEVGVLIEEPFSILPLHAICNTAEKNVRELTRLQGEHLNKRAIGGKKQAQLNGASQNGVADGAAARRTNVQVTN